MSITPYINNGVGRRAGKSKEFAMINDVLNYSDFIKSQNKNGVLSHPDVQQKMLMLLGQEKNSKLELSEQEENKIAKNYQKMFFALATIRWCNGATLGVARQKSLEQMNSFVKSKTNIAHPMNKYLMSMNNQMFREISQRNMTDENSDKKININSTLAKKWLDESTKEFQKCLKELNEMYQKYMPEKTLEKMPATKSFENANQKAQQMLMQLLARQKQKVA